MANIERLKGWFNYLDANKSGSITAEDAILVAKVFYNEMTSPHSLSSNFVLGCCNSLWICRELYFPCFTCKSVPTLVSLNVVSMSP